VTPQVVAEIAFNEGTQAGRLQLARGGFSQNGANEGIANATVFEIARVVVRLDDVVSRVVNADDGANADIRHRFLASVFRFPQIPAVDLSPVALALRGAVCSLAPVESTLEGSPR